MQIGEDKKKKKNERSIAVCKLLLRLLRDSAHEVGHWPQTLAAVCLSLIESLKQRTRSMWSMPEHKSSPVYFIESFNWFALAPSFSLFAVKKGI